MAKTIESQLAEQGLRLAQSDESGWYVVVMDGTAARKVWATNA